MPKAVLVALLLVAGCGHSIGDACKSNVDCSPTGDRFCDTSAPNGYCTQENCSSESCPGDSVCIRFFTALLNEPCGPTTACPHTDERCVCDVTDAAGNCANGGAGHCAPSSTERRWCQKRCAHDGDCRSNYQCRSTGTNGSEPVPTFDLGGGQPAKFCAPTGIPVQ